MCRYRVWEGPHKISGWENATARAAAPGEIMEKLNRAPVRIPGQVILFFDKKYHIAGHSGSGAQTWQQGGEWCMMAAAIRGDHDGLQWSHGVCMYPAPEKTGKRAGNGGEP